MNRKLLSLARDNHGKGAGIRSEVAGDTATIYVYDIIDGFWGVSAADLAAQLSAITAPKIQLRINCPGGDVFEARAMMTLLTEHSAEITAKVDGVAASAASVLILAASSVEVAEGAFIMIHNAWSFTMGDAEDLRATAAILDQVDASLVKDYADKTGKPVAEIQAWMRAETWFTAQEAVDAGFADAIAPSTTAAKAQAFNLAVYEKAPKALTEQKPDDSVRERMLARLGLYERTAA